MSIATEQPQVQQTRKPYQWPEFITPGMWISQDQNGEWWAHQHRPYLMNDGWGSDGDLVYLSSPVLDFDPPQCSGWRESVLRKPVE